MISGQIINSYSD